MCLAPFYIRYRPYKFGKLLIIVEDNGIPPFIAMEDPFQENLLFHSSEKYLARKRPLKILNFDLLLLFEGERRKEKVMQI